MSKEQIKRVAQRVMESNGRLPVSRVMVEEGYPETTAKNPQQITRSKTWIDFIEKELPDELLVTVHKEGLQATKLSGTGGMSLKMSGGKVKEVQHSDLEVPDYATRHKYLDTAYKLKGSYAPEKSQVLNVNVDVTMTEKEKSLKEEYERKLKESILE